MSGDYSRLIFDPSRDYAGVLLQQGRPLTDADWNDLVAQIARRVQAGTFDTFGGAAVVPTSTPDGFALAFDVSGNLTIGRGRIYVDGLLAENHGVAPIAWDSALAEQFGTAPMHYDQQPYLPHAPPLPDGGPHIVYVDVWEREVTQFEDSKLVDKALGVDTTTRVQIVSQVKVLTNSEGGPLTCDSTPDNWKDLIAPSAGRLTTGTATFGTTNPCLIPPTGGYTGQENQLYRIEIHQGGAPGTATFKWSRDNRSVETRVTRLSTDAKTIFAENVGKDHVLRFKDGDWIEITDDRLELTGPTGQPNGPRGELHRISIGGGVDDALRTITLDTAITAGLFPVDAQGQPDANRHTRIRRWDQRKQVLRTDTSQPSEYFDLDGANSTGAIPVPPNGSISVALENGIVVNFNVDPVGGTFYSGDYWVFAARTVDASVEPLDHAPPRGIHHHYAKLGLITLPNTVTDCRQFWPPETGSEGCDCTVCVSEEDHNGGAYTLQHALDQVKDAGGTVCLGPGVYHLDSPLAMVGARSVRVRGQGWRTVLVATAPQTVVQIEECIDVTMENLAVIGSAASHTLGPGGGSTSVIGLRHNFGCRLQRLFVVGVSTGGATSVAIGMAGYAFGTIVRDCVVAANVGIASSVGGNTNYLLTVDLGIEDNLIWCSQRGISLDRFVVHIAEARLRGNTIMGAGDVAVLATGGVPAGFALNVAGNIVQTRGDGIVIGTDGVRVIENDVSALAGAQTGDGIALVPGLDPSGIDACQILTNRVSGMHGHGIALRTRVNSGMIKQNIITGVGGGGIIMEDAGSAKNLAIENNQLVDIAENFNEDGEQIAAIRVIATSHADILNNVIHNVARKSIQGQSRAGIQVIALTEARICGNRLSGIGRAAGYDGQVAGIQVLPSFVRVDVEGNSVRRAADDDEDLFLRDWRALAATANSGLHLVTPTFVLVVGTNILLLLSGLHLYLIPLRRDNISVRGNSLRGEWIGPEAVRIDSVEHCVFAENNCAKTGDALSPSTVQILNGRSVIANANQIRGTPHSLSISLLNAKAGGVAALANVTGFKIQINGANIAPPWSDLNIVAP